VTVTSALVVLVTVGCGTTSIPSAVEALPPHSHQEQRLNYLRALTSYMIFIDRFETEQHLPAESIPVAAGLQVVASGVLRGDMAWPGHPR
jgi:hypothetical protein